MYGLTPWIISLIDPRHCDLHKTHLFNQSLHMQPIRCSPNNHHHRHPPTPTLLLALHKQCQRGHKRYITRLCETFIWSFHKTYTNGRMQQHLRTEQPKQTCRQTGLWDCQTVNHPTLKQKALMNILVTELIAVNYKLCSHCGPTKEDIPTLQSDIITKVRRTLLCVIHPWQPTLTDDLPC